MTMLFFKVASGMSGAHQKRDGTLGKEPHLVIQISLGGSTAAATTAVAEDTREGFLVGCRRWIFPPKECHPGSLPAVLLSVSKGLSVQADKGATVLLPRKELLMRDV